MQPSMNTFSAVLLIEDNPGDARLVRAYLQESFGDGCRLHAVNNLGASLVALRQTPFDVVLLDLGLPDSSGLDTYLQIKQLAPQTPVIILTGADDDEQADAALRSGADDYLLKNSADGPSLARAMRYAVERRRAAEQLRASEARFRNIVETAEEGILQVDQAGTIVFANTRMAAMLGSEPAALRGRALLALALPAHAQQVKALLSVAPGCRQSCEVQLVLPEGPPRWVVAAAGKVAARGRQGPEVVVMLTDIEARKLAEEELLQLKQHLELRVAERTAQLQAVAADLEAFNYSVAHDLRNPLHGILGVAALMQAEPTVTLTQKQHRHLSLITSSANNMNGLIGGLLSLARISGQSLQTQQLDLSAMAKTILHRLELLHPQRSVQWFVEPSMTGVGDAALIEAVVQNLLDNAWKYSANAAQARIYFGLLHADAGPQVYQVQDNGVGFDAATAQALFTPFHRLSTSRGFAGTGVGLATVRRIIDRHGGRIWFESKPGVGTSFFFTLPDVAMTVP
jgi:PAS domain S-box-containing protein